MKKGSIFVQFSKWASRTTGASYAFVVACVVVVIWAISGPAFHFSDTWQLVINTGTTIITFLALPQIMWAVSYERTASG